MMVFSIARFKMYSTHKDHITGHCCGVIAFSDEVVMRILPPGLPAVQMLETSIMQFIRRVPD